MRGYRSKSASPRSAAAAGYPENGVPFEGVTGKMAEARQPGLPVGATSLRYLEAGGIQPSRFSSEFVTAAFD